MIGLDTNVLLRHLTQDDPVQSATATELIEKELTEENPGFVSVVAMVELVWVLRSAYRFADQRLATAVEQILQTRSLLVENEQEVFRALTTLKSGAGSFADALIGTLGQRAGCAHTVTFDRKASRLPEFELV
jgi:predicted nucleic-acid-binding protein